jgi:hypothetical protein
MKKIIDLLSKANTLSLISKIIALVFVIGIFIAYIIISKKMPTSDEVWGVIQIGIFCACVFVPVDLSMITKNIKGGNDGQKLN